MSPALLLSPDDTLGVALRPLVVGERISNGGSDVTIREAIPAKHKFAMRDFSKGEKVQMYGVTVGVALTAIPAGALIHQGVLAHATDDFSTERHQDTAWAAPDVSPWQVRTFLGYHRADGSVGTANHWLVIPMVFCENRNVEALRQAFLRTLGYDQTGPYERFAQSLATALRSGKDPGSLASVSLDSAIGAPPSRLFPHVDGVHFLTHSLGCGGTRDDAAALCGLLAGYITHPNTAGATVLSLGCENAQLDLLHEAIRQRSPHFDKPLLTYTQQAYPSEKSLMEAAIRETFLALTQANECRRTPAPLHHLCVGVECGGSDGFSGISANPTVGAVSDRVVALGGRVILSEFPELCGVEQSLVNRCTSDDVAARFVDLMDRYSTRAKAVGSDFSQNPSPGNIRDGLITDAMKSAGAARKGGSSPVVDALDYPELATEPGLTLLCTPGGDVESTTAMAGAHATVMLFTTGLGTPTGNPICPVIKISTTTELAERLPDLIDFDTGPIIRGEATPESLAPHLLDQIIAVASGECATKAGILGQHDFQPWKRGVSL